MSIQPKTRRRISAAILSVLLLAVTAVPGFARRGSTRGVCKSCEENYEISFCIPDSDGFTTCHVENDDSCSYSGWCFLSFS